MKETITSLANSQIKEAIKLKQKKYRDEKGLFLIEGKTMIFEAQNANLIVKIFTSNSQKEGILVAPEIIQKLAFSKSPQDSVAICRKPGINITGNKILFLDRVQDPGNVGTLIRSAIAFGWDGVIINYGADVYNEKTISSSQGATFKLPCKNITDGTNLIKNTSLKVVGATLSKDAINYQEMPLEDNFILVIGNEGKGISSEIIKQLDYQVYIPINFESLNAAIAGSILMNEYKG